LGASNVNSILELSLCISSTLLALLAFKDLFPVCCWLCLLPETYFQYAVYFACSQRLISSMLLALLESLGASKVNNILEISLWEQAKPTAYWK
jgi:hypothetical protein